MVGLTLISGSVFAATPATTTDYTSLQAVVNYDTKNDMSAANPLAKRGVPKQVLEAYAPTKQVATKLTNAVGMLQKERALQVALPMNDTIKFDLVPAYDGFPKQIPTFAKEVEVFYTPQFEKAGAEAQVSFMGTPEQLAPYLAEAKKLAVLQTKYTDSRSIYVKSDVATDMRYAFSLRELLPDYKMVASNTLSNIGEWREYWATSAADKAKTSYDEATNKKLQQEVLGYNSYTYVQETIPVHYDFYIFDVGTEFGHPYVTGAAFEPNGREVIYFHHQQ